MICPALQTGIVEERGGVGQGLERLNRGSEFKVIRHNQEVESVILIVGGQCAIGRIRQFETRAKKTAAQICIGQSGSSAIGHAKIQARPWDGKAGWQCVFETHVKGTG